MKIYLAILTYNALAHTKRCIDSLLSHTTLPFEVQIVDNASSDGTRAWLAGLADPRIRIHYSNVNLGVPGGRNELLRKILPRAADDDFVIFLDNDIELHAGWHLPFERLFDSQPRAGMASKVGWVMEVREDTRDPQAHPWEMGRVDIVAGGFACWARVEAIREVGKLDENLGLFWHEDDDWAVRFTAQGWSIWSVPEAEMTHREHASGMAWSSLENGDSKRNLAYLTQKWRRLGYVDDQGWIRSRDPLFCPSLELRDEIKRRLNRVTSISRGEYVEAYWDLHALFATVEMDRVFPRPISPCLTVLLELLCEGMIGDVPALQARYQAMSSRLEEIRVRRNIVTAGESLLGAAPGSIHGVARIDSWENADWLEAYRALKGPASTADWYGRNSKDWAETTLFLGLAEQDLLGAGKRGLILEPSDVSLAIALAEKGTDVLLAGRFDSDSELPAEFLTHSDRWLDGRGRGIRVCRRNELNRTNEFDFVIARLEDAEDPKLAEKLIEMEWYLAPGGQVALIVPVTVGLDGFSGFAPEDSMPGLKLRSCFRAFMDRASLASSAAPISWGRVPDVCRREGTVYWTHALLIYDQHGDRALPRPVPIQPRKPEVLVDLRGMAFEHLASHDSLREGMAQLEHALRGPGHPQLTLLADGACHQALRRLLVHAQVRYRDAHDESSHHPDLIQYIDGPRNAPPRCMSQWKGKPVLGMIGSLSRDRSLPGFDLWNESGYVRFLQEQATLLLVPDSGCSERNSVPPDLDSPKLRCIANSTATLPASPYSPAEAQSLMGLSPPYLMLEGSLGARQRLGEILVLLEDELRSGNLSILAYGWEFRDFQQLIKSKQHPLRERIRFVTHVPEDLRRPLYEGALCLIDAKREGEFCLGAIEAAEVGLPLRRLCSHRLIEMDAPTVLGSEDRPSLGDVWREVLKGPSLAPIHQLQ